MTLKELKQKINELPEELGGLEVWAETRGPINYLETNAILINPIIGADYFLPSKWDYTEWSEYFEENIEDQIILFL